MPNRYLGISPQRVQGRLVAKDTTGKWGVMTEAGQWVLKPQYEYVQLLGANRAAVWQFTHPRRTALHFGRKRTLVALPSGKIVLPLAREYFLQSFDHHGLAKILGKSFQHWYRMNKSIRDENDIPWDYSHLLYFDKFSRGVHGLIDTMGKMTIATKYDEIGEFREGLAAAQKKPRDRYSFIKPDGSVAIQGNFIIASHFQQGWARVLAPADSLTFIQKKNGKLVLTPASISDLESDRWGFINKKGEWMIKPRFEEVSDFYCIEK
ncbi:WG repeat-containing protein [uncultured Microscilla sp.]|uniref:WG repeat-containing protein n=1 Tax=uncultured Microscilla sp. TaxID=432653 RepID=UPI0026132590|nr:WG repeat-containing protein [uncultured Microscilla sp.]